MQNFLNQLQNDKFSFIEIKQRIVSEQFKFSVPNTAYEAEAQSELIIQLLLLMQDS